MLHIMVDIYGSQTEKLNDLKAIYETIYKITNYISVKTVMPPVLVPYYYGKVKEDDGISAFVILKGGHLSIHTFPERECYFVDVLYDGFISEDKFIEVLSRELPFEDKIVHIVDRRFNLNEQCDFKSIDENTDFGPHYLIRTQSGTELDMQSIYTFLDELPMQINMDPILRPVVITDKVYNPTVISGVTVIAQSHIALHYHKNEKFAYIDIFSCSFINCDNVMKIVEDKLGVHCDSVLIGRGSKHSAKLASRSDFVARYNKWKNNIL